MKSKMLSRVLVLYIFILFNSMPAFSQHLLELSKKLKDGDKVKINQSFLVDRDKDVWLTRGCRLPAHGVRSLRVGAGKVATINSVVWHNQLSGRYDYLTFYLASPSGVEFEVGLIEQDVEGCKHWNEELSRTKMHNTNMYCDEMPKHTTCGGIFEFLEDEPQDF